MTFYEVLGVSPTASTDELRAAYLRAARAAHPDVTGGDDERMALINDAWATLSVPDHRRRYDRELEIARRNEAARRASQLDLDPRVDADPDQGIDAPLLADDTSGTPLSAPMQWLTRLTPMLLGLGVVAATVGILLQVRPIFVFGVGACVAAGALFALAPFFAMSAKR